jgi:hypothetical protein
MRFRKSKVAITIWILLTGSYNLQAEPAVSALIERLRQLNTQLDAISAREDKSASGLIAFNAEQNFQAAEQSFKEREFVAVIRHLNFVLNQLPQMPQNRYLLSQYLLGRSYEELGYPNRATKAYIRYLNSYATQAGDPGTRLIEVIRRILLLGDFLREKDQDQVQRLLANLMSMAFEPDVKAEVTLLSGIAAYHNARNRLAADWLKPLLESSVSLRIRAEATFYAAQNALAMGRDQEGEELLLKLVGYPEPSLLFIRDLATLNLARFYAAKKMPQKAWEWYQKVEGPGASLRLAAYEAVLLLIQSQEYSRALQLARSYIANYPKSREAYQLQERMSFLQLHAGNLDPAEGQMQARDRALDELQQGIVADFRNQDKITAPAVRELISRTEIMAMQSPVLEQSQGLSVRLEKVEHLLAEQRQEIRNLIFTLGRIQDPDLRPEVQAMDRQYRTLIRQLFAIGDGLLANEQGLYAQHLTPATKTRLERSKARRQLLEASPQELRKGPWQNWTEIAQQQLRLGALAERIERKKAELAALQFQAHTSSQSAWKEQSGQISQLLERYRNIEKRLARRVEEQRLELLKFISEPSPLQTTRKYLLLGTQELLESGSILEQHRDHFQHPLAQHQQEDIERAWDLWQRKAGRILSQIKRHEAEEARWLTDQLNDIQLQLERHRQLKQKSDQLAERVHETTARALPAVLDHFDYHIQEQRSRAKKWLADLQWQRYMQQTEERLRLKQKADEREAEVQENLKDLELRRSLHE